MKPVELGLSTLIFVVGTRVALAFGVGLLVADHIPAKRRRALALSLIGIGRRYCANSVEFLKILRHSPAASGRRSRSRSTVAK